MNSKTCLYLFTVLSLTITAAAQSLAPPHAEFHGRKLSGHLELGNESSAPLAAILEVSGFTLDANGAILFTPPDPSLNVELGATSFTIAPRAVHHVFYRARSARVPVWFAVVSTLTPARPVREGLRVNVVLPHFVYLTEKGKLKAGDVLATMNETELTLTNVSQKLARVAAIRAGDRRLAGFPLLPGQARRVSLTPEGPPGEVQVRFTDGLKLSVLP